MVFRHLRLTGAGITLYRAPCLRVRASYRIAELCHVLTVQGARRTTLVGANAEAEATIPAQMKAANLMLRTRQNHEEEHDEIDTSSYQCTVRTIGAYSMFGVQAMAAPRWAWTHLYIAKQKVKEKESKPSLYVFPQNSFVVYFTSNSVRQRKNPLSDSVRPCSKVVPAYCISALVGLAKCGSSGTVDTGERKAKLRRGAASIPARH